MILARELQRRFDCFRAATGEPDAVERARRELRDQRRQFFGRFGREEARVRIFETRGLLSDRCNDVGAAVTQAGNRGPATRIQVAPSVIADDEDSLSTDCNRKPPRCEPVKDVAGGHYATLTAVVAAS